MSVEPITDAQAERFRRLAWPMMPVVLRTAHCLTRRGAEDLAQETMVKAMRAIDTYQDDTDIRAWLLTILRRTHIDQRRAEASRLRELRLDESLLGGLTVDGQTPVEHDSQWDEPEELLNRFEDEDIVAALRMIPDDIRWTLLLVDIEQLAHAEAAVVLDVAVGTIKSRLHRGRARLRDRLYELAVRRGWVPARSGRYE